MSDFFKSAIYEFFEKEFDSATEKGFEQGIKQGQITSICNIISRNLAYKYGNSSICEQLRCKIEGINNYPALEEIQLAIWQTSSLEEFTEKLDEILKTKATELGN